MCGIFGVSGVSEPQGLESCARLLSHRGPDGFGSCFDDERGVYLAHCRLAVIDLSSRGAQPMSNEDGTVWITYNGEIYAFDELRRELENLGHRFVSGTDTEVIIHAYEEWGTSCLERFNGMFAFALWDKRRGKVFLVRDRLGIKPLYYGFIRGKLVFASEPKALAALPFYRKAMDHEALLCFLLYRYTSGPASIWEGIRRLSPGHFLEYDVATATSSTVRYWDLPMKEQRWNAIDAVDQFEDLLGSSVRRCLVSDVPVGVFLSGGYDSSSVAIAAAAGSPRINTFTIGFEGWESDETGAARETAAMLHTTHHEDRVTGGNFPGLEDAFGAYDEPLADSSIFPTYLVSRFARRSATVALSGDGGDELFGGYLWYTQMVDCTYRKRLAFLLQPLLRAAGAEETAFGRRCSMLEHYRLMTSPAFRVDEALRLFPSLAADDFPPAGNFLYRSHLREDLEGYRRWQYLDLMTYLPDNNLTKVDRASMAHSLEVRVPFLDHRIVEFAFSLPENLRIRGGEKKYLVRRFLEKNGAAHLLHRPKQGFSCQVANFWPLETMVEEIRRGELVRLGVMDRKEMERIVEMRGRDPLKIWILAVLERWFRRWMT